MGNDLESSNQESYERRKVLSRLIDKYYIKMTFEYAYELESLGLWQWAIFVVLHLKNSPHKTKYIRDTLLKYAESEENDEFLISSLKIPEHYIHEAKAIYHQSKGDYAKAFLSWMKSGESFDKSHKRSNGKFIEENKSFEFVKGNSQKEQKYYQKAHDILINYVFISSESFPEKFEDLQLVIENLEKKQEHIKNWEKNGKILCDFLRLRRESLVYLKEFFDEYGEFRKTSEDWKNQKTAENIRLFQNRLEHLIKNFEVFGKYEITENMTVTRTELKRILLDWDTKFKIINAKLNKGDQILEAPNNYLFEGEDLSIVDKKNALDRFTNATLAEYLSAK